MTSSPFRGFADPVDTAAPGWLEVDRWQWWQADGGEPWALLESWLADREFPVRDMSIKRQVVDTARRALLLLGAQACSGALGLGPARPSPVPGVPDIAVVVQEKLTSSTRKRALSVGRGRVRAWSEVWNSSGHKAAIESVRQLIASGEVYQVNIVDCWTGTVQGDPRGALRRILDLPGADWGGAIDGEGWAVVSASPESLIRVRNGQISSRPVKGTVQVGENAALSQAALLASAKDRAEHVMIVDLVRNDLARVARTGSVAVDELFSLHRWAQLWHAHSVVSAQVRQGVGLADVLKAVLPGGSVTGAPKIAALSVIADLELLGRGPAMGGLGSLSGSGELELGLTIRTAAMDEAAPGGALAAVWAGGGITWGSQPATERVEALAKAQPLLERMSAPL